MAQKLSEQEVAQAFVHHFVTEAQRVWPTMYADLRGIAPKLEVSREDVAAFDLALAEIALGLQGVKNLFPKEQAARIHQWVFKAVDVEDWGTYAVNALNEYIWIFDKVLASDNSGSDSISATSSRLLERWLDEGIKKLEVRIEGVGTEAVSPLLITALDIKLVQFATSWSWKSIQQQFDIAPESNPLSEDPTNKSRLGQFLEGAAAKLYRELIAYHIKRQSARELWEALRGEYAVLPSYLQSHVAYWEGYSSGTLAPNKGFWESSSCRQAFERIMSLAIETLPLQGHIDRVEDFLKPENHTLAFQLFQVVTLNLAYLASTQRSLRAFMGIRKGLFG